MNARILSPIQIPRVYCPHIHVSTSHLLPSPVPRRQWYHASISLLVSPQPSIKPMSSHPRPSHSLKSYSWRKPLHPASFQPLTQVLALTDIKSLEFVASVDDCLDTDARDTDTASNGKLLQFQEMQSDTAERGIADGTAAEGEVEATEMRAP